MKTESCSVQPHHSGVVLEALALLPSQKQRQTATGDTWQRRSSAPKHLLGGRKTSQVLPSRLTHLWGSAGAYCSEKLLWLFFPPPLFSAELRVRAAAVMQKAVATRDWQRLADKSVPQNTCFDAQRQAKSAPAVSLVWIGLGKIVLCSHFTRLRQSTAHLPSQKQWQTATGDS